MRTITTQAATVLSGPVTPIVVLVEMLLTSPLRINTSPVTVSYGGFDWVGAGTLGAIDQVADLSGQHQSLKFTLSGISSSAVAAALGEDVRNKPCTLKMAVLDPDTHAVLDAPVIWSGTLDTMSISHGPSTSSISVTAEPAAVGYARPKPLRYIDSDQQRLFPGDTSMRFVVAQSQHEDVWPAASFFRK